MLNSKVFPYPSKPRPAPIPVPPPSRLAEDVLNRLGRENYESVAGSVGGSR